MTLALLRMAACLTSSVLVRDDGLVARRVGDCGGCGALRCGLPMSPSADAEGILDSLPGDIMLRRLSLDLVLRRLSRDFVAAFLPKRVGFMPTFCGTLVVAR
jgi:hypothetical protein